MTDDRRPVKTYVPAAQKERWQAHAEDLDMSQSEFVRTMVQAGRRGFTTPPPTSTDEAPSEGSDPQGSGLESRVEALLSEDAHSWEELLDAVFDDVEERLEDALDSLQDRNRVRYNGREGGYVLADE
jgi:hypothetical protein